MLRALVAIAIMLPGLASAATPPDDIEVKRPTFAWGDRAPVKGEEAKDRDPFDIEPRTYLCDVIDHKWCIVNPGEEGNDVPSAPHPSEG